MIAYVVTEGPFDAELLRRVLPQELLEGVEFVVAGGVSAAKSLARSLLVRRQTPVAVVLAAEAVSPELVQERRQSMEEVVESVAGNVPVIVIVAIPAMEAILFHDPALLERRFGQTLPESLCAFARTNPRDVLEQLFAQSPHIPNRVKLVEALTPIDVQILQQTAPIQELVAFLRHAQELAIVGASTSERM
jgi:hypothetical protein